MSQARNLFPFTRPYLPLLAAAVLLLTFCGLLEALIVTLLEPVFNLWSSGSAAGSGPAGARFGFLQNWLGLEEDGALVRIALFLVLFSFLKGVFLYLADNWMAYCGHSVVASLRKRLYQRLLDHSLAFYARHPTGQLMARVISDTERLQDAVSKKLADFVRQSVLLVAFLGLVFYIDWKLSLVTFLLAPVVLGITTLLGRKVRRLAWLSQQKISDLSQTLQETITGQRIVKAFGMQRYEEERFRETADQLVRVEMKSVRYTALSSPLMEFLGYLLFAPFLLYVSHQIGQGVSVGAFVSFIVALFKLYDPIRKLSQMHLHFQQASASSNRIFELLQTPFDLLDRPGARPLPPFGDEIRFERVSFAYPGQERPVLRGIDLRIGRGEIVALVGASGAGKSTLASLVPRFYDVTEGRLLIDGRDVRDVTQESLRAQIAIVSQDTFLFNDTLRNNIAYGRQDCSMEEVEGAARAAYIDDFIGTLPRGYDTVVGERGQRLSGGQRQRIAIARAILKRAPILILDEATSALDSASEQLVQKALENLMRDCTTVVIAHRLSTVRMAHRIVVLDEGRIVETGDHEQLIARAGVYQYLYRMQHPDESGTPVP